MADDVSEFGVGMPGGPQGADEAPNAFEVDNRQKYR